MFDLATPNPGGPSVARANFRLLPVHDWPLNIRELEKALTAASLLAGDDPIGLEHLPESMRNRASVGTAPAAPQPPPGDDDERRVWLLELLRAHSGNISAVIRASGKARMQIQRWLERYGISASGFASRRSRNPSRNPSRCSAHKSDLEL